MTDSIQTQHAAHDGRANFVFLPRLLNQSQLAEYLGKSTAWCERARWTGEGPPFVKLGRHCRYRAEDVAAWVNQRLMQSTTAEGEQ